MGLAWTDGGGRGRATVGRARGGAPNRHTDPKRSLGRAALYGYGLSTGVLSALSWLSEVLSALGVGAVSEPEKHKQQGGRGRNVKLGAGDGLAAGNRIDRRPGLIVTGLAQEARIAAGAGMAVVRSNTDSQGMSASLTGFGSAAITVVGLVRV